MKTQKRRIPKKEKAFYFSTEERQKCSGDRRAVRVFYHASEVELGLYCTNAWSERLLSVFRINKILIKSSSQPRIVCQDDG